MIYKIMFTMIVCTFPDNRYVNFNFSLKKEMLKCKSHPWSLEGFEFYTIKFHNLDFFFLWSYIPFELAAFLSIVSIKCHISLLCVFNSLNQMALLHFYDIMSFSLCHMASFYWTNKHKWQAYVAFNGKNGHRDCWCKWNIISGGKI